MISLITRAFTFLKTLWNWRVLFRDRLRQVQAAAEMVADELQANARRITQGRQGYSLDFSGPKVELRFDAWRKHAPTLHALSRPHPELWDELRNAYAVLEAQEATPRDLPEPETFYDLGEKLRTTMRDVCI